MKEAEAPRTPRIVVLISGSGSNLQALIDAIARGEINAEIAAVICNKPDTYGLTRAKSVGIETIVLEHRNFAAREQFDAAMIRKIEALDVDLIVLAGFMRILTPDFVRRYQGRLLNIHPSLLPKFPGLHTHQRALDASEQTHGVTVHFVTTELDRGPNIIQASVPVLPNDTAETLAQRVLQQEHIIYPIAVKWFVDGRLTMTDEGARLDNKLLPVDGLMLESQMTLH